MLQISLNVANIRLIFVDSLPSAERICDVVPALLLSGVYRCREETAESVASPFELMLLVAEADLSITENAAAVQFSTLAIAVVVAREMTGGDELWLILQTSVDPLMGECDKGTFLAFGF